MNKEVLKMFLNEDLNTEELNEALPKALANAYKNSGLDLKQRKNMNPHNIVDRVDFQNAQYDEISPEEGKEVWKDDPQSLILVITGADGNDHAVKFREDGKVDIDPNYGNYRFDLPRDKAYVKRDGTRVVDVFKAKINHLLSIAKKIYKSNEHLVKKDQDLLNARKQNPESPRNTDLDKRNIISDAQDAGRKSLVLLNKLKDPYGVFGRNTNLKLIPDEIKYDEDTGKSTWVSSYGGTHSADEWKSMFIDYFNRWGSADYDTFNTWLAYLLASQKGDRTYRNPTEKEIKDWYNLSDNWRKDAKAKIRYLDAERALREPKDRVTKAIHDAKQLEYQLKNSQSNKDSFISPERRASREADITWYINRYKSRLMDILKELEEYEMRLDDLDAEDAKKVKEFDDEIADLTKKIADAKQEYTNTMNNGAYTNSAFGRKVPESLQEEKSLDELVDILANRRSQNEDLTEDFTDDERKFALAEYLNIDPEEVDELDRFDFDTPEGEYLVLTEEEGYDRAMDEVKMTLDDLGLEAFTPNFQREILDNYIKDDVIDSFIDDEIDYFETQENDPEQLEYLRSLDTKESKLDYIRDIFGDLSDFIDSREALDEDEVARAAVDTDGVAHFIAYYDGEENELGNGYFAYRIN